MATTCMHLGFRMNLNVMKKVILAVCGETNTSSIVLQLDEDDCEVVKLWRIW
jgi:hypothetical protein